MLILKIAGGIICYLISALLWEKGPDWLGYEPTSCLMCEIMATFVAGGGCFWLLYVAATYS